MADTFRFLELRVELVAAAPLVLESPANTLRGALGYALGTESSFAREFFEGKTDSARPSGMAEIPRPFLIRAHHLAGVPLEPGDPFEFTMCLFDLKRLDRAALLRGLEKLANNGIGARRSACRLGQVHWAEREFALPAPEWIAPAAEPLRIRFETAVELRSGGKSGLLPEFPLLMSRLRDRAAALSSFYGEGLREIDFAGFTVIAEGVRLVSHRFTSRRSRRYSTRTGDWHPVPGLVGEAVYEGPWNAYESWLRLGESIGVGKQTAFGKGVYRLIGGGPEVPPRLAL